MQCSAFDFSATPISRQCPLSDPPVFNVRPPARPPAADQMRQSRLLHPGNQYILSEAIRRPKSTTLRSLRRPGLKHTRKQTAKLRRAGVKETEIAASKYQRWHDVGLAKMRYKLKKRKYGLLERKRIDRRERRAHAHKKRMAEIKVRRLKVELRRARAGLAHTCEERIAELQARMLELGLG